jgi:apolipoprotein N-acyltransferase
VSPRVASLGWAVAAGVAGWTAHPPLGLGYTSVLVIPFLLAGIATASGVAFRLAVPGVGFVAGLATFLPMLTWLVNPAGYLAWVVLCLFLSLWYALAATVIAPWVRSGWVVLVAPLVWTGAEAWRNLVPLGGFGWGSFADAQVDTVFLPLARLVGGNGVTFAVALSGALLYVAVRRLAWGDRQAAAVATGGIVAIVGLGIVAGATATEPDGPTIDVLAVQGNDTEEPRYTTRRERHIAIATNVLEETRASVARQGQPDLTVWPESAIDRDPWGSGDYLLPFLEDGARVVGGSLLAGTILDGPRPEETFYNTVLHLEADGSVTDEYTKRRYVPFGEYVPWPRLRDLVPALQQIPRDGVTRNGPHAVRTAHTDVAVVICFETLFSDVIRSNVRAGDVGLIVAATNDASFGRTAEPAQHLNQSRVRAVETGRYVVHAALSGSTAFVASDGRVLEQTGLFEIGSLRRAVPLATGETPYLLVGDVAGFTSRWALVLLALLGLVRERVRADR